MHLKLRSVFSFLSLLLAGGCSMLEYDREKNCLNPQALCFRGDSTTPAITAFTPAADSILDNSALTVGVDFSEKMDTNTFTLQNSDGACTGNIRISVDNFATCLGITLAGTDEAKLRFNRPPTPVLPANYRLRISGLKDKSGISLAGTFDLSFYVYIAMPDTGQTGCVYDDNGDWSTGTVSDATCTQTYTAGSTTHPRGQDAHHAGNTKGWQLTDSNQSVTDTLTQVSFNRCFAGQSWNGSTCKGSPNDTMLVSDVASHCTTLNSANYAGHNDWRVPTNLEFFAFLFDFGDSAARLPAGFFNYSNIPSYFWTSNAVGGTPHTIMSNFPQATTEMSNNNINKGGLCVRGTRTNNPLYISKNVGGGDVVRSLTGNITFTKCSIGNLATPSLLTGATCNSAAPGTGTWFQAAQACENLVYAGSSNWRLPNIKELIYILHSAAAGAPYIDAAVFPGTASAGYWTATHYVPAAQNSYYLDFSITYASTSTKTNSLAVRCVTDDPL